MFGAFSSSYSQEPLVNMVKRSTPMNVNISLSGISAIGEEGYLVVSVNSEEPAINTEIKVSIPEGFSKVSGNLSWVGDIAVGQTIEVQTRVKIMKVGDWIVRGEAISRSNGAIFGKSAFLYVAVSENGVTVSRESIAVPGDNVMECVNVIGSVDKSDEVKLVKASTAPIQTDAGTITAYGWWYFYEEDNTTLRALRHAQVELWDNEPWPLPAVYLDTTYTDNDGYYCFDPVVNDDGPFEDGLDLFVKVFLENSVVKVTDSAGGIYCAQTHVDGGLPDGPHNIGAWALIGPYRNATGIFDTIDIGHEYAVSLGYNHVKVEAIWPVAPPPQGQGTHTDADGIRMYFVSGDGWDEDVILHEYGHTIQHSIYGEWIPNSGGPHTWNQHTNPNFAFSEGWPTFFAVAANFEMGYGDSLYPRDSWYRDHVDQIINHELETDNHAYGVDVEGAVACLLWDIYDSSEDVLAHGTDSLSAGMSPVWDVFANYLTGGHHVYNIHPEFWNG